MYCGDILERSQEGVPFSVINDLGMDTLHRVLDADRLLQVTNSPVVRRKTIFIRVRNEISV